jgi:hypothetical protein
LEKIFIEPELLKLVQEVIAQHTEKHIAEKLLKYLQKHSDAIITLKEISSEADICRKMIIFYIDEATIDETIP